LSKPKRKGGPLRIPAPEEEYKFTKIDFIECLIPLINLALAIIFIILIPNSFIDLLLFFMLILTGAFFLSFIIEYWQRFWTTHTGNSLLLYNSANVSPFVLYLGQFVYGYFFLSFIILGYIEAVSILSIIVWVYFGFSTLFLILCIWAVLVYVKEAGDKKKEVIKNLMEDFNKHKNTENYAAQNYYLQRITKVMETPEIKAGFLSKLITLITILLTIVPFIIPV